MVAVRDSPPGPLWWCCSCRVLPPVPDSLFPTADVPQECEEELGWLCLRLFCQGVLQSWGSGEGCKGGGHRVGAGGYKVQGNREVWDMGHKMWSLGYRVEM